MNPYPQKPAQGDLRQTPGPGRENYADPVVLIVEDHDDTREMLKTLLSMAGCHVIEAEDGDGALNAAEKAHPDLILLDMKIPRLDGLTVTRLIRSHPILHEVPIVAVTGNGTPQFQAEVLRAGCNYCLVKPIDFDRLEELIQMLARSAPAPVLGTRYSLAVRSRGVMCSYQFDRTIRTSGYGFGYTSK
jgi:two-component system, cell cycle response regulator DivK